VFLTSQHDEAAFRRHPVGQALARLCEVEFSLIDDLITDGNHSTTITLAYARRIREAGDAMLDTAFLMLVSDYIVADGALATVFDRIAAGASGVMAGNFQIVAEDAVPVLRRRLSHREGESISLHPRELLKLALPYIHPATSANIVNLPISHNAHTNRLFWRVDDGTLLGRFYLMHMIGIRPEVTDFVVGASCDYSFIPEMCPSDNVAIVNDSDDYLVVEMQPRDHEAHHLKWGPLEPADLAASLAEWTTERHRKNVAATIVYHTGEIPAELSSVQQESDRFIAEVSRRLTAPPQPYRNHPYWIGAIAAHRFDTAQSVGNDDYKALLGAEMSPKTGSLIGFLWHARRILFGSFPDVTPWHPRWPDLQLPLRRLREAARSGPVLIVSNSAGVYGRWLAGVNRQSQSIDIGRLLNLSQAQYTSLVGRFQACLIAMPEGELKRANRLLERVGPALRPHSKIFVLATNDRDVDAGGFATSFAYHSGRFTNLRIWIRQTYYIQASRLRWLVGRSAAKLARWGMHRRALFILLAPGIAMLACATYLLNRRANEPTAAPPRRGLCSSVLLELETSPQLPLPDFSPDAFDRSASARKPGDSGNTDALDHASPP
jgi:hypothetical protein